MDVSLKPSPARGEALRTTGNRSHIWDCHNRFPLICIAHPGESISVRCGRWRTCRGCALRKQWELRQRFLAGILNVPSGRRAMFVTLTFPVACAPDEDDAHAALRSLVRRLRHRGYLGAYGWVLQRTRAGVLHHHLIAHMPWFDDGLAEWRELIVASGYGVQNRLTLARPEHAAYCAQYISHRLADLAPLRRAYSFSRDFPLAPAEAERRRIAEVGEAIGLDPECEWIPPHLVP